MEELLAGLASDPETLGLVVHGSRAHGVERPGSDVDVVRVVSDEEYARREAGGLVHEKSGGLDVMHQTPERLRRLVGNRGWWTGSFLSARVVFDRDGDIEPLVQAIVDAANEAAFDAVPEAYDGYLNSWVRSLKAWRRGDELGGRLHAAESSVHLLRTLFGLERRWLPNLDGLEPELPAIEQAQGWEPGFLRFGRDAPARRRRPGVSARARGARRGAHGLAGLPTRLGRRSRAPQAAVARGECLDTSKVVSAANTPSGPSHIVVHMFDEHCTCDLCGRVYRYDYRRGHSRRRCNSCRRNHVRLAQARKERLVDLKGGRCELCGYSRCLRALTFHHLDPATKRFNVANSLGRSWAALVDEVARCVLVCENCHREVEAGFTEVPSTIRERIERSLVGVQRHQVRRPGRPCSP